MSNSDLNTGFRPDRRMVTLTVLAVAAAAWVVLVWGGEQVGHQALGHGSAGGSLGGPGVIHMIATVWLGWAIMVIAMMLPPALPMLNMMGRLDAGRRHPWALLGSGAAAFLSVWLIAGSAIVAAGYGLRALAGRRTWLTDNPEIVSGAVLIGAGIYQFTPLKDACLRACRSPRGFAVAHWRGLRPAWMEAGTVAGAYGLACLGCCWALMAVSFAVGLAALPVMVVMAIMMASERLTRRGRALVRPTGVLVVYLGVAVLLGLLPPGLVSG